MLSVKVTGFAALNGQLQELAAKTAAKALTSAARKAFKPVVDAARARVASDTSALRDAIKLTTKRTTGDAVAIVGLKIVGPSRKQRKLNKVLRRAIKRGLLSSNENPGLNPRARWHFEEFGTSKTRARPYIRPAFDANVGNVINSLKKEISEAIHRAVRSAARAAAKGGG
jgi:HK97 gp10 family phage protein